MKKTLAALLLSTQWLCACSYNPLIENNHETGSATGTIVGAGAGTGIMAALGFGSSKPLLAAGGIGGGVIGYYSTTLRYDAGGIIQSGGQVYTNGKMVGINIPSDQLFTPNTDEFRPQAPTILDSVAAVLARYPNNNILISGNTSGFGRSKWEQRLSERRAQKVSAYLWKEGITPFKEKAIDTRTLKYVGYGDYFPISNKETNHGIRQNNRIQITAYPTDCDLNLDKRHVSFRNMGALDDDADKDAPISCPGCFKDN